MMLFAHLFPKFLMFLSYFERYPSAVANTFNVIRLGIFRLGQVMAILYALEKKFSCKQSTNDYCKLCQKVSLVWSEWLMVVIAPSTYKGWRYQIRRLLQYDGSNDDLDWRIEFRYLNFICIMKYLRSRLIKSCFIEWKCLHLSNINLRLDLI